MAVWRGPILVAILVLAAALRVRYLMHPLAWDEAKVMNALVELVRHGKLTYYWTVHGPAYLVLGAPIAYITDVSQWALSLLGVSFSLGVIVATWLLARELFDEDSALISALALAVMPMNVIFSTWIKQDSLMTLFIVLAVWLFVRRRWLATALALAGALLTKEYALLMVPALALWCGATFQWRRLGRWLALSIAALLLPVAYFAAFVKTGGQFLQGFFGIGVEAQAFGRPWYQYLVNAPKDLGWVVVLLAIVGFAYALQRWMRDDYGYVLPVAWAGMLYAVHSVGAVKGQWYLYYATPAVAMLAGTGGAFLLRLAKKTGARILIVGLLAAAMVVPILFLGYAAYTKGESYGYDADNKLGRWLALHARKGDKVAFSTIVDPVIMYYSGLREGDASMIPTTAMSDLRRILGQEVPYKNEAKHFVKFVQSRKVRWVVVYGTRHYATEYEIARKAGGEALVLGDWAVVDVSPLWEGSPQAGGR